MPRRIGLGMFPMPTKTGGLVNVTLLVNSEMFESSELPIVSTEGTSLLWEVMTFIDTCSVNVRCRFCRTSFLWTITYRLTIVANFPKQWDQVVPY